MAYITGMFKGKKITLIGLGLLGRGIGDAKFFAEEGADVIVTDLKSPDDLKTSVKELKNFPNIRFVLGEHRLEDFKDRDFILKAANVPLDSPYLAEARKNGIPIEQSTAIFASLTSARIIGITGTRGKSTTTHLIHHMLMHADIPAHLGGNLRGVSTLPMVRFLTERDTAVLELDSWQLQGFGERMISPKVAVFTNFMPDHLNYYKGDLEAYFSDKTYIFKYQKKGDTLVVSRELYEARKAYFDEAKSALTIADERILPILDLPALPGDHNRKNLACALAAVEALGVPRDKALSSLRSFGGLEGRLEFLREVGGIKIYNDTNSTTPDATLAGLEALAKNKNVVIIMGGADKQLNMAKLVQSLDFYCKRIVILPGTGSDKLSEFGFDTIAAPIIRVSTLPEAVGEAMREAKLGDVLLFSPAFASFGLFKNEYDRGDQFKALVGGLKN